jgi:hypothetical protein
MRTLRWGCFILVVCTAALSAGQRARTLNAEKEGLYSAATRYPEFEDDTPVARLANKVLKNWATARQSRFIKECSKNTAQSGKQTANYTYTADYEVTCASPERLLSIRFDTFKETGGAHGAPEYVTFSFGLVGGKARRLKLVNFFTSGSAFRDTVTTAVLGKLRRNPQAILVVNGDVTSLTEDQLNRFSVEADGLTFFFNPYEVGPYSSGRFQVKLTVGELGADFNRALLPAR